MIPNTKVSNAKPSPTLALNQKAKALAAEGKPIINLTAGELDFPTENRMGAAVMEALKKGKTFYTASEGILELRQAIAANASTFYSKKITPNQVVVTNGAKHAIFNFFFSILEPQDEVILFAPFWVSYAEVVELCGGKPVVLFSGIEKKFTPDLNQVEQSISPKTKVIVITSPNNPTGMVLEEKWLKDLNQMLQKYPHVSLMVDDIYSELYYESKPYYSAAFDSLCTLDRCAIISGVSKTYAMTGWRLGWSITNVPMTVAMTNVQSQFTSNPSTLSQWGALEAITGDQSHQKPNLEKLKSKRDLVWGAFQNIPDTQVLKPQGAFYFFPNIEKCLGKKTKSGVVIQSDVQFCQYLLSEYGVALVPGSAFGAPGYFRMSFAAALESLKSGMEKIETAVKNLT